MSFKKTQASVFMIIGVVLVIIILMYLLLSQTNRDVQLKSGFDDVDMNMPIKACIDLELDNALFLIGYQGGYLLNFPAEFIENFYSAVPYWLYNGIYSSVTTEMIEEEIKLYLNYTVPQCVNYTLTQYPMQIKDISSSVTIYDDRVSIDMDLIVQITKGDKIERSGRFISSKQVNLGKMIKQAEGIVFELMEVQAIPMTFIAEQEYPTFIIEREDGYVLEIVDYNHEVKDQPYSFYFAVSFIEPENSPPLLYEEGPFIGYVGEEIHIDYDAKDDAYENQLEFSIVTFEPYNDMEIDVSTGIISYIPQVEGKYTGYVKVTDVEGLSDSRYLDIEVEQR